MFVREGEPNQLGRGMAATVIGLLVLAAGFGSGNDAARIVGAFGALVMIWGIFSIIGHFVGDKAGGADQ